MKTHYQEEITVLQTEKRGVYALYRNLQGKDVPTQSKLKRRTTSTQPIMNKRLRSNVSPVSDLSDDTPELLPTPTASDQSDRLFKWLILRGSSPKYKAGSCITKKDQAEVSKQLVTFDKQGRVRNRWRWQRSNKAGVCIHSDIIGHVSLSDVSDHPWIQPDRACLDCTKSRRPCIFYDEDQDGGMAVLLPLADHLRKDASETDVSYWILPDSGLSIESLMPPS